MGDTLMGVTTVPAGFQIIFFTIRSAGTYLLAAVSGGGYVSRGNVTFTDIGSGPMFGQASAIPIAEQYALFPTSDTSFVTPPLDTWGLTTWNAVPTNPYLLSDPVLTATPGDTMVELNWTAPARASADARAELVYTVRRGTVTPPTTPIASNLTALLYDSVGLVNGTTYYHRVVADVRVVGAPTPISVARSSNITTSVPAVPVLVEAWGAIAQ